MTAYIHPLTYNYCALTAAILNEMLSVDGAISKFSPATEHHSNNTDFTLSRKFIEMRKTMQYKEIGSIYGLSAGAVYQKIRYYKRAARV